METVGIIGIILGSQCHRKLHVPATETDRASSAMGTDGHPVLMSINLRLAVFASTPEIASCSCTCCGSYNDGCAEAELATPVSAPAPWQ